MTGGSKSSTWEASCKDTLSFSMCTYCPPRIADASAATTLATIEKLSTSTRPWWNGSAISDGKKACPARRAASAGDSVCSGL